MDLRGISAKPGKNISILEDALKVYANPQSENEG